MLPTSRFTATATESSGEKITADPWLGTGSTVTGPPSSVVGGAPESSPEPGGTPPSEGGVFPLSATFPGGMGAGSGDAGLLAAHATKSPRAPINEALVDIA